jgi:hypothetical protein
VIFWFQPFAFTYNLYRYIEDLRERRLIDSLALTSSSSAGVLGGSSFPCEVVSPVEGGNMRAGNPSRTLEAFVRMLTCLPVAWPASVASAATLAAVLGSDSQPGASHGRSCVLQHFGPQGGKGMTLRALRDQGDRLRALGITVITEGDDKRRGGRSGNALDTGASAALTALTALAAVTVTDDADADAANSTEGLYARVLALVLNTVELEQSSTLSSSFAVVSVVVDVDTPLVSAAGLTSAQALAVAASLRRQLGPLGHGGAVQVGSTI